MSENEIRIGCSGYYYSQWKNDFYPEGLSTSRWLEYYSSVFNTVELNGTFYRVPKLASLKKNYKKTPDGFKFSVKTSRYITHVLKMKDSASHIKDFTDLISEGLSDKFDKLLFQLPPSFHYSEENLAHILENIPASPSNVIEFRHESWWNGEVEKEFKKKKFTFCNVDYPGLRTGFMNTSKNFYLRLHGVPDLFKSRYSSARLKSFADKIPSNANSCNIYFNNTFYGAAYENALELMGVLSRKS